MSGAVRTWLAKLLPPLLIAGSCPVVSLSAPATGSLTAGIETEQTGPLYAIPTLPDRVGRIVAAVMINGRGPFRFMLDTGCNRTILAQSVLAKLDLAPDPDASISVVGVAGSQVAARVHIDSLDAGAMHFRHVDLAVLCGPVLDGLDGILGMEGFDGLKVSADFVRNIVSIF